MATDRSATVPEAGVTARQVFSVKRGDIWQARHTCGWTSGDLPIDSRGFAYHVGNLHVAICPEGSGRGARA